MKREPSPWNGLAADSPRKFLKTPGKENRSWIGSRNSGSKA